MDHTRWELIKSLVDRALTLKGRERETYIATICRNHPAISTEIREMLESIEESERNHFMQEIRSDQKNMLHDIRQQQGETPADKTFLNREIGPYRITEILGEGGMGSVFRATRADGEFQQQVAIKLIKNRTGSNETLHRFRVEREILAGLQHPNIAHLLDGGLTKDGISFLVLEYIDGKPIDQYCDENRLTIAERLELFKDVCSAVQYAHTKLIVHRDLKPDNIFVTNKGVVKVLDFGIAKLLDPQLQQLSGVETLPGQKIWTPQYAAPEQLTGKAVTVGTDIYALGILLHKILAGSYPYQLDGKNLAEMEHIIRNATPILPSQSLKQHHDPETCALSRKTTAKALLQTLRGDLDALVAKAIRKEPEYRYQSVKEISDDIDRYTSGTPIQAREGTYRYRAGKFIRRHKAGLSAAASFLIILLLFAGIYTWRITEERNLAQMERDKLEQVVEFMTTLFDTGNPIKNEGVSVSPQMLLERGVDEAKLLKEQPDLQAHIYTVVGNIYMILGEYHLAEERYREALNINQKVFEADVPALAESMNNIARALTRQGKYDSARTMYRRALDMQINHFGEQHPEVAETLSLFGSWTPVTSMEEAARMRERSLQIRRAAYGDHHIKVADSYIETGRIKRSMARPDEAIIDFNKALEIRTSILGPNHPDVAECMVLLGDVYTLYDVNRDSAEFLYRHALQILQPKYQSYHPSLLHALGSYADLQSENGNHKQAQDLIERSLEVRQTVFGDNHPMTADGLNQLAEAFYEQGLYKKAADFYRKGLKIKAETLGRNHLALVGILRDLAKSLIALGEYPEARNHLRRALQIHLVHTDQETIGLTFGTLAYLNFKEGNLSEAENLYQHALSFYKNDQLGQHYDAIKLQIELDKLQIAMNNEP